LAQVKKSPFFKYQWLSTAYRTTLWPNL